jgi:hypothetical protein
MDNKKLKFIIPKKMGNKNHILKFKKSKPNLGMYPIPTGKILERYAYKHNLVPMSDVAKTILSKPELIIGMEEPMDRSKPKKMLTYHEAVRRFKHICPCKDSDGDGVANIADCRPFDKRKQDIEFDLYDKYGNTKPGRERPMRDKSEYIPIRNPKQKVEVQVKSKEIEKFDKRR